MLLPFKPALDSASVPSSPNHATHTRDRSPPPWQNIVSFYGVCLDPSKDVMYMVEEYCEGGDLSQWMRRADYTPAECSRIIKELLGGVCCMHDRDIAHRDLKPQNVLMTRNGMVRIADLGQARNTTQKGSTVVGAAPAHRAALAVTRSL